MHFPRFCVPLTDGRRRPSHVPPALGWYRASSGFQLGRKHHQSWAPPPLGPPIANSADGGLHFFWRKAILALTSQNRRNGDGGTEIGDRNRAPTANFCCHYKYNQQKHNTTTMLCENKVLFFYFFLKIRKKCKQDLFLYLTMKMHVG